jgi:hypothetical protein
VPALQLRLVAEPEEAGRRAVGEHHPAVAVGDDDGVGHGPHDVVEERARDRAAARVGDGTERPRELRHLVREPDLRPGRVLRVVGGEDAVAALLARGVQVQVGALQEPVGVDGVRRQRGDASAHGDGGAAFRCRRGLDLLADAVRDADRVHARGAVEQQRHRVPVPARDVVRAPRPAAGHAGEVDEGCLPVRHVPVRLQQHEGQEVARAARALRLLLEPLLQEAGGEQPGERVVVHAALAAHDAAREVAHALDLHPVELLEHVGTRAEERPELEGRDLEDPRGRARAHGRGARATLGRGELAHHRARLERAHHDLAVRPVLDDLEDPFEEKRHVVARVAFAPQPRSAVHVGLDPEVGELRIEARLFAGQHERPPGVRVAAS